MRPLLVVGIPRSGTTWIAKVIARGTGASYLEEPDNHFRFAFAFRAKAALGLRGHPLLVPGDSPEAARDYELLWRAALAPEGPSSSLRTVGGRVADRIVAKAGAERVTRVLADGRLGLDLEFGRRLAEPRRLEHGGRSILVKSVYAALAVEWIAQRHDVSVVVAERHPLNIVSSWQELGWLGADGQEPFQALDPNVVDSLTARFGVEPPTEGSSVGAVAWLVGALGRALGEAAKRNPSWHRVVHEDICRSPKEGFQSLAEALALPWSAEGGRAIDDWNRPGHGYETHRVAVDLPRAWESRLSPEDIEEATGVLERFSVMTR